MIFEIKRSVNADLMWVEGADITQTLLESFYTSHRYGTRQVVGCLSDTATWHFVNVLYDPSGGGSRELVAVTGSETVIVNDRSYEDLGSTICQFLLKLIDEEESNVK